MRDRRLLMEEIRRVECSLYRVLTLDETAYLLHPNVREHALLESKDIIRFGIRHGSYPRSYARLLESDDVLALRVVTSPNFSRSNKRLDEAWQDWAIGIGQMIPAIKTGAGIAGIAYYGYEAYKSFTSGSPWTGALNIMMTLLSAAAIEPTGATAFTGPIVSALGPIRTLGVALENFIGLLMRGAFKAILPLVEKTPILRTFLNWFKGTGGQLMESAVKWMGETLGLWSKFFEGFAAKRGTATAGTAEGKLASIAEWIAQKLKPASETIAKWVQNLRSFVRGGTATAQAEAGAAAATAAQPGSVKAAFGELKAGLATDLKGIKTWTDDAAKGVLARSEKAQVDAALQSMVGKSFQVGPRTVTVATDGTITSTFADTQKIVLEPLAIKPEAILADKAFKEALIKQGLQSSRVEQIISKMISRKMIRPSNASPEVTMAPAYA